MLLGCALLPFQHALSTPPAPPPNPQRWFDIQPDDALVAKEEEQHVLTRLHHVLKPFLLRRLKVLYVWCVVWRACVMCVMCVMLLLPVL